jgi:hypothetical protein
VDEPRAGTPHNFAAMQRSRHVNTVIVTNANTGLGFECARALAETHQSCGRGAALSDPVMASEQGESSVAMVKLKPSETILRLK